MTYKEIAKIAKQKDVSKTTIDKDWILGHFLNAMYEFSEVKDNFVFKGGTCLKKCYFEDYRFSEDLDFTLLNPDFIINENFFQKIIKQAEFNSESKFYLKDIKSQLYNNTPQGYETTVLFWGADHKPNQRPLPVNRWKTKIKIDISFSEKIILKPELRNIFHNYSDSKKVHNTIPSYPLKEITAEKLRSILQRNRPRDIYDMYFLSSIIKKSDYKEIFELLRKKAKNKNVSCCKYKDFVNQSKYNKNKRAWDSSLGYHLPVGKLLDYDIAYTTMERFVRLILENE